MLLLTQYLYFREYSIVPVGKNLPVISVAEWTSWARMYCSLIF